MTSSYYRGAHGIIVVYDITDKQSFENVKNWIHEVEKFANESVCMMIVGNKTDKEASRQVTYAEGAAFAEHYKVPFIETSAKAGTHIDEAFMTISRKIYAAQNAHAKKHLSPTKDPETKVLTVHIDDKRPGCCGDG